MISCQFLGVLLVAISMMRAVFPKLYVRPNVCKIEVKLELTCESLMIVNYFDILVILILSKGSVNRIRSSNVISGHFNTLADQKLWQKNEII